MENENKLSEVIIIIMLTAMMGSREATFEVLKTVSRDKLRGLEVGFSNAARYTADFRERN